MDVQANQSNCKTNLNWTMHAPNVFSSKLALCWIDLGCLYKNKKSQKNIDIFGIDLESIMIIIIKLFVIEFKIRSLA